MPTPSKLTPAMHKRLVKLAKQPGKLYDIAREAGISVATLGRWRKLGRGGDERYAKFFTEFDAARGTAARALLARIEEIGEKSNNWLPYAWLLERSYGYTQTGAFIDPDAVDEAATSGEAREALAIELLLSVEPTGINVVPGG